MTEAFFIGKRAVMSGGRTALFIHENPQEVLKDKSMVIFFSAMLNEIYRLAQGARGAGCGDMGLF